MAATLSLPHMPEKCDHAKKKKTIFALTNHNVSQSVKSVIQCIIMVRVVKNIFHILVPNGKYKISSELIVNDFSSK